MNKSPHISIILPVYSAEKTLQKCIESILSQEFTDFELIIINDGSKDNSFAICDNYSLIDKRIILINQTKKGVSDARNKGLDYVRGKYICFVDADDWVEKEYLSTFFREDHNPNKEMVIQSCFEDSEKKSTIKTILPDKLYDQSSFSLLFTELHILGYGYPFAKLYKTTIIKENNLYFDTEIHFIEDLLFFLNYLQYINTLQTVSQANYHYKTNESKATLSYSHNSYESEIKAYYSEKKILETLTSKFNLSESAIDYWKANNGFIFYRAIRTFYRPEWKKNYKERISILEKQWNNDNIYCLNAYKKQSTNDLPNKISILLYSKKWIYVYDIYMNIFVSIRYNLSFVWKLFRKFVKPRKHQSGLV